LKKKKKKETKKFVFAIKGKIFPGNFSYYSGKIFNFPCSTKLILKYVKPFYLFNSAFVKFDMHDGGKVEQEGFKIM
jgi:hypothetical protein